MTPGHSRCHNTLHTAHIFKLDPCDLSALHTQRFEISLPDSFLMTWTTHPTIFLTPHGFSILPTRLNVSYLRRKRRIRRSTTLNSFTDFHKHDQFISTLGRNLSPGLFTSNFFFPFCPPVPKGSAHLYHHNNHAAI